MFEQPLQHIVFTAAKVTVLSNETFIPTKEKTKTKKKSIRARSIRVINNYSHNKERYRTAGYMELYTPLSAKLRHKRRDWERKKISVWVDWVSVFLFCMGRLG